MAEDISRPPPDARDRRRGGLARRALQRVRAAMHRARDPGETTTERAATSDDEARNAIGAAIEPANTTGAGAESSDIPQDEVEQRHDTEPVESPSIPFAMLNSIEVDSSEEDAGESAMPAQVGRAGFSRQKARSLFAQNGFDYRLRTWRPLEEPPNKIRRVEKPIRLRVHYTCHECTRQLGLERTCMECGHQRCRECLRNPPREVRQVSDNAPESRGDNRTSPVVGPSTAPPVAEPSRLQTDMRKAALELDDEYSNHDLPQDLDLAMYTRPRAAMQTVWKPQARPKQKHALAASSISPDDEAPVVRAVQRVYRKPRQRVRYTCEQCDTLFVDHDQCWRCGHERCDGCLRQPPKRTAAAPDPEVLRSLEARLASHGESSTAGAAEQS